MTHSRRRKGQPEPFLDSTRPTAASLANSFQTLTMRLGTSSSSVLRGRQNSRLVEQEFDHRRRARNAKYRKECYGARQQPSHRPPGDCSDIGFVCFVALAVLYIMHFYIMACRSRQHDQGDTRIPGMETQVESSLKASHATSKPSGLSHAHNSGTSQNMLPGAIESDSKSFEGNQQTARPGRDPNTLPGAIHLDGAFDADSSGTPLESATASAPSSAAPQRPGKDEKRSSSPKRQDKSKDTSIDRTTAVVGPDKHTSKSGIIESKNIGVKQQSYPPRKVKSDNYSRKIPGTSASSKDKGTAQDDVAPDAEPESASNDSNIDSPPIVHGKVNRTVAKQSKSDRQEEKPTSSNAEETSRTEALDTGPHPMSRTMTELQVAGGTGKLDISSVKAKYSVLVKAYLAPFAKGISRKAFFSIMRRKNYSLAPPNSNKGIQTILFQIIKKKIYMLDPYEVAKNSKPFYRSRINELIWLLDRVAKKGLPDTEFLVAIHDCVQTINKPHTYRGAHFQESSPTFTIVACNFSDNVPFPMWEGDEKRGGGFKGWDAKMEEYKRLDTTPWAKKASKAVFRGGNRPSMFFAEKADADARCDDVGRSRLSFLSKENPELFDVSLSGQCGKSTFSMSPLSEADHHSFKYILYAEGNCFWADRLNKFVFGPSAIVKQETPCGQFWEPLLQPMTHYLPTDFFFSDTTDRIKWGNEHSEEVQNIVKNANEFAENYLSLSGIEAYVEVLLTEYTTLLKSKVIKIEKGAIEAPVEA